MVPASNSGLRLKSFPTGDLEPSQKNSQDQLKVRRTHSNVTDGVFSMDEVIPKLPEIPKLAKAVRRNPHSGWPPMLAAFSEEMAEDH